MDTDRVVIVTGAAGGIGTVLVETLPRQRRHRRRDRQPHGITVNVVTPGLTVTKAVRYSFPPALLEAQRSRRAIQRDEVLEDLVGPVFFLASSDSAFISSQTLNIDGGMFMP